MKVVREGGIPMVVALGLLYAVVPATTCFGGQVVDSGFCLTVAGRDCARPLSSGQRISIQALERDEVGRRVLYFQSTQAVRQGELFVHAWERSGSDDTQAKAKVHSRHPLSQEVRQMLETFRMGLLNDALHVVMEAGASSPTYRAVSSRHVAVPGKFVAKVVDPAGQDFPGSKLYEVEIVP